MRINEAYVSAKDFPAWHYVELKIGEERRVAAVFHNETPAGTIPFWYDDPDHPQRALPLLESMEPINLGDYGSVLQRDKNMEIFVALCKAIDDLPEPLITVQCIQWLNERQMFTPGSARIAVRHALNSIDMALKRRRSAFDDVMTRLCGLRTA